MEDVYVGSLLAKVEGAFRDKQYPEVLRISDQILRQPLAPEMEARVLAHRGRAHRRMGRVGQALSCLTDAYDLAQGHHLSGLLAEIMVDQAAILAAIPDRRRCEQLLEALLSMAAQGDEKAASLVDRMWFNLAVCREWAGDLAGAAKAYEEAARGPNLAGYALVNQAGLLLHLGDITAARAALDQVKAHNNELELIQVYEAWYEHLIGNSCDALAHLDGCGSTDEWVLAEVHLTRARIFAAIGDGRAHDEAVCAIEVACRTAPEHGQVIRQARWLLRSIFKQGGMSA